VNKAASDNCTQEFAEEAGVGEAVGVGFQDEGAEDGELDGSEAAGGFAVEGAGGAMGEGEGLLEGG
jgi:hypothetical protein